jgi:hypothetical protein
MDGYARLNPLEIVVNRERWDSWTVEEQVKFVRHERGHILTGTMHVPGECDYDGTVIRNEAAADRHALRDRISDARVREAFLEGCETVGEYAAFWRVDLATAEARLNLYRGGAW